MICVHSHLYDASWWTTMLTQHILHIPSCPSPGTPTTHTYQKNNYVQSHPTPCPAGIRLHLSGRMIHSFFWNMNMCACTNMHTHICVYIYVYICLYMYMYIYVYISIYMYICVRARVYVCIIYMYMYIYVCIYVYVYMCIVCIWI